MLFDGRGERDGTKVVLEKVKVVPLSLSGSAHALPCLGTWSWSTVPGQGPLYFRTFIDARLSETGKGVPPLDRLNRANQNNMLLSPNLAPHQQGSLIKKSTKLTDFKAGGIKNRPSTKKRGTPKSLRLENHTKSRLDA
jgi:hypothetical protein